MFPILATILYACILPSYIAHSDFVFCKSDLTVDAPSYFGNLSAIVPQLDPTSVNIYTQYVKP